MYCTIRWRLSGVDLASNIPATTDLVRLYRQSRDESVLYLQNRHDRTHMSGRFESFMDALPRGHRVRPLLIDGPQGHHPPDKNITRTALFAAILGEELPRVST